MQLICCSESTAELNTLNLWAKEPGTTASDMKIMMWDSMGSSTHALCTTNHAAVHRSTAFTAQDSDPGSLLLALPMTCCASMTGGWHPGPLQRARAQWWVDVDQGHTLFPVSDSVIDVPRCCKVFSKRSCEIRGGNSPAAAPWGLGT